MYFHTVPCIHFISLSKHIFLIWWRKTLFYIGKYFKLSNIPPWNGTVQKIYKGKQIFFTLNIFNNGVSDERGLLQPCQSAD